VEVWVGATVALLFSLIFVRRIARREFAVAALAAGMALMAAGMVGGMPSHPVQGPLWAAAFGVLAVWPIVWSSDRLWPIRAEHLRHMTGGLAMVYMCAATPAAGIYLSGVSAASGAHHGPAAAIISPGITTGLALPLIGWLLASYFLLQAIGCATRRRTEPVARARRIARFDEVGMGAGMAVMLLVAL
jgi:hypothetical protein